LSGTLRFANLLVICRMSEGQRAVPIET